MMIRLWIGGAQAVQHAFETLGPRQCREKSRGSSDSGHFDSFAQDHAADLPADGPERHADNDFMTSLAHRISQQSIDPNGG